MLKWADLSVRVQSLHDVQRPRFNFTRLRVSAVIDVDSGIRVIVSEDEANTCQLVPPYSLKGLLYGPPRRSIPGLGQSPRARIDGQLVWFRLFFEGIGR